MNLSIYDTIDDSKYTLNDSDQLISSFYHCTPSYIDSNRPLHQQISSILLANFNKLYIRISNYLY